MLGHQHSVEHEALGCGLQVGVFSWGAYCVWATWWHLVDWGCGLQVGVFSGGAYCVWASGAAAAAMQCNSLHFAVLPCNGAVLLYLQVSAAEEVITFRGVMGRSNSQAAFLTFCTFVALGSAGLVLSVLLPEQLGAKAYLLTLLSPYAGIYYWNNAQRDDEVVIKMETSDDEQVSRPQMGRGALIIAGE